MAINAEIRAEFIKEATWHGSLACAEEILAAHPELEANDVHIAAILGNDAAVRGFIEASKANATALSEPYGGNALVYLCLSKYLRLDPTRTPAFLRAATALLDAGADANSGFMTRGPHPEFETALYGAAGVAHHPGMTRLLLERGADPNDVEAVYHSPETYDNRAMQLLVETGKLTAENLALMLIRKHDWHDIEGAKYLLSHGADPNHGDGHGWLALHHALARNNSLEMIELLLDHRADPMLRKNGQTAVELAARRGRADVLRLFSQRGFSTELQGVDRLIAACALDDSKAIHEIAAEAPAHVREVVAQGGKLICEFAGTWNTPGVRHLLDLGVPVDARFAGDGYWQLAPDTTALHVASWMGKTHTVKLLIERGADVNARDAQNRTPLQFAVRACVDSYWMDRRTPDTAAALLQAGAIPEGIKLPTGYDEIDILLATHA